MSDKTYNRILHIPRRFSQADWGGTEAVVTELCKYQQSQGYTPEIYTSKALNHLSEDQWGEIPIRRYDHCYPFFGLSKEDVHSLDLKGGNLLSWALYRALCKADDVRIYHAHVTKRMGGSVLKAAQQNKRPCVVTLHGNMFDVPKIEAEAVTDAQNDRFEWGKPFGAYFKSRALLDEADAVLCVGFSEFEKAKQALNHDRVYFLSNGVEPTKFEVSESARIERRKQLGIPEDAVLFGCISRIDPQKDQETLLEAFEKVAHKNPNCWLLLCGPETVPSYGQKLRDKVKASPFKDRIIWLPPLDSTRPEHPATFAALDVFVLPSRHEPFGIVILEAWAANKPVVVSGAGGLDKLVTDGKNGLKVGIGNVGKLTHAIESLTQDPALRLSLAKAGRLEVAEKYTWHQIGQSLEQIYQKVLEPYG